MTSAWLNPQANSVTQSPDVCQRPVPLRSWLTGHIEWGLVVTPGLTAMIDKSGTQRVGIGATASLLAWRYS